MEQLLKLALIGTARAPAGDDIAGDGPTAALVAAAGVAERERRLLLAAGAETIYQSSGRRALSGQAAPAPAPAEDRPTASPKIAAFLRDAALTNDRPFLADALRQLREAGLVLPHEFLPIALDLSDTNLRAALLPLMSNRGRWLARLRPEWSWVDNATTEAAIQSSATLDQPALEKAWSEGSLDQRRLALRTWHRAAPEEARRRLLEVWKTEKAETRGELLGALADHLTPADEATLEAALDDRSVTVRQLASELLTRLPTSQLTRRLTARADALLSGKTSGLIRRTFTLTAEPPQELDAPTERDGISAKPPAHLAGPSTAGGTVPIGKRAFWLTSIVAKVRPSHWTTKFAHDPAALLAAIAKDDFADATVDGWTQAAVAFAQHGKQHDPASAAWLPVLADYWAERLKNAEPQHSGTAAERLTSVVAALPAAEVEATVGKLLQVLPSRLDVVLGQLLPRVTAPWSAQFAGQLIVAARMALASTDSNIVYAWTRALALAADALPGSMLSPQLEAWSIATGDTWQARASSEAVERFTERIRVRRLLRETIQLEHPSRTVR